MRVQLDGRAAGFEPVGWEFESLYPRYLAVVKTEITRLCEGRAPGSIPGSEAHADDARLVELAFTQGVAGSSPARITHGLVVQREHAWSSAKRAGFNSPQDYQRDVVKRDHSTFGTWQRRFDSSYPDRCQAAQRKQQSPVKRTVAGSIPALAAIRCITNKKGGSDAYAVKRHAMELGQ